MCFVHQITRFQVRGEDDELIERNFNLLAVGQVQVVAPFFQGHDPAVQQFVGAHALTAEVVDHQRAAIALQLQRRFTDFRLRVLHDFQLFHRQFTARNDGGPNDLHPALVDAGEIEQPLVLLSLFDLLVDDDGQCRWGIGLRVPGREYDARGAFLVQIDGGIGLLQ
ncbi:MAG: hypothetical protein IH827_00070 [Myxococcales bacterium]|nr:hypothetical protein [Myxococcales bacterium]